MDVCRKCGALLRDNDRFCSQCGARITWRDAAARKEQAQKKRAQKEVRFRTKPEQGANYRENFEEGENRSRALLTTVTILAVMLLAVAAVAAFLFLRGQKSARNSGPAGDTIQILTEGGEITLVETGAAEAAVQGDASAQSEAVAQSDVPAQSEVPAPIEASAQSESPAQSETVQETEAPADTPSAADAIDPERIRAILDSGTTASAAEVYIRDLKHDSEAYVGDMEEPMVASALITVPILYTAAARIDAGELSLDTPVTYVTSIGGRGEATTEPRDGLEFPLSFFLETMVRYSDNNCINTLIDFLTLDSINQTCRDAGYAHVDIQRGLVASNPGGLDNYFTAREAALMVCDLYTDKFSSVGADFMREYFRIDAGDSLPTLTGLAPGLADASMVLNQNGHGDTRYNEVTVVEDDGAQYILAVMLYGDMGFSYTPGVTDISEYVNEALTGSAQGE